MGAVGAPGAVRAGAHRVLSYSILFHCITLTCTALHSIQFHSVPFNSIQFHSIPFDSIQCHSMPFNAIQCHSMPFNAIQCHSMPLFFCTARDSTRRFAGRSWLGGRKNSRAEQSNCHRLPLWGGGNGQRLLRIPISWSCNQGGAPPGGTRPAAAGRPVSGYAYRTYASLDAAASGARPTRAGAGARRRNDVTMPRCSGAGAAMLGPRAVGGRRRKAPRIQFHAIPFHSIPLHSVESQSAHVRFGPGSCQEFTEARARAEFCAEALARIAFLRAGSC